jgi:hypothetical protein
MNRIDRMGKKTARKSAGLDPLQNQLRRFASAARFATKARRATKKRRFLTAEIAEIAEKDVENKDGKSNMHFPPLSLSDLCVLRALCGKNLLFFVSSCFRGEGFKTAELF